jgi:asparagine synthase (glutamine-hydrolysing)
MCGIFFYYEQTPSGLSRKDMDKRKNILLDELLIAFMQTAHRGPDSSVFKYMGEDCYLGFHRLAINDLLETGNQPFEDNNVSVICNGEIYNHEMLRSKHNMNNKITSKSDCAVILPLYQQFGIEYLGTHLDGDFAMVILDKNRQEVHLLRDPMGVKPLFYYLTENAFCCASEMKSMFLDETGGHIRHDILMPGSYLTFSLDNHTVKIGNYWKPKFYLGLKDISYKNSNDYYNYLASRLETIATIKEKLTLSVQKRLMCEKPFGLFLSGGLDSSLIAGIVKKLLGPEKMREVQTFSIGLEGSPDLEKAQIVADFLGSKHVPVYFTVEEGIQHIHTVIRQLETYDITTIRASIPQYILSKYIEKNTDVRVILSGEGSDELFAGYMYSHNAPSNSDLQLDSERLVKELYMFDVLRTDRTTAGNGLEVRVPFLDRGFIKYVATIPAQYKNPKENAIEKWLLRDAFFDKTEPYIPEEILNRPKDAFSDACGYDWIPSLKAFCEAQVPDEIFSQRFTKYPHLTPTSKESYYYREIFESYYPRQSHILKHFWLPKWTENQGEPSAKILKLI